MNTNHNSYRSVDEDAVHPDELAARFEEYGTTPPRTRMNIKKRDWDRRQKAQAFNSAVSAVVGGATDTTATIGGTAPQTAVTPRKGMTRMARSRVLRRNTMDCALLNEMFVNEDSKRSDKRAQAILRDQERELKNSMASIIPIPNGSYHSRVISYHENSLNNLESLDKCMPLSSEVTLRNAPKVVESANRYMSVSSLPIGCRQSAPAISFMKLYIDAKSAPGLNIRKEFHETFANLIKLGSVDRQEAKVSLEKFFTAF